MLTVSRLFLTLSLLSLPLFASIPHADVNKGVEVVLTADAKKWFNCEGGSDCEDSIYEYALGTITKLERFKVFVKMKEGGAKGAVLVGNYNEAGMDGVDLATPEKLQERKEWLQKQQVIEKERQAKIKALAKTLAQLKGKNSWDFEGVHLGTTLSEARKTLRKKDFRLVDLGDNIWAVNRYTINKQEVLAHLWFNDLGLLYLVKIQGEPLYTQQFQKTVVGQYDQFSEWIVARFGSPAEEKRVDIYDIADGEEVFFKTWSGNAVQAMAGFALEDNRYSALAVVKSPALEESED